VVVPNAVTTLLANLSETNVQKVELIEQIGEMTATMTTTQPKKIAAESLIQKLTTTTDGTEIEKESELLEFDDFSDVDYDLDYTVQY
tara:strand:- start:38 stop:298 length:261 start_codon:yes stop_codon:yes gene_type:complete